MAGVTGLEPAASGVTGRRSNQLSYTPETSRNGGFMYCTPLRSVKQTGVFCVRAMRSNYTTRLNYSLTPPVAVVGDDGIEPPTLSV